jgi:hypothetical protein
VCSSLSIIKDKIKKDEMDNVVKRMMEKRNTYKFLAGQPEEKSPLRSPRNR